MAVESNLAGVVRVAYEAVTGEFNRDSAVAAQNYVQGNEKMSDSAIRLELAQDKLRRAIARGPAASRAQASALLQVRQAERDLARESDRTTRELQQQERTLSRVTRGAVAGSGVFHGLGRSVAFASGTFLGGAGLVYALRSTLQAGRDAEASSGRVAVAVRNSGNEYARYRDEIDRTITKQSELSAFDDEDLADSFAKLVIRTKDVREALRLTALVTDVARGRQISLEAATQLVIKASLNQAGQLRRVGIEVGKNTTGQQLLNKLTETYAGQAQRYGREGAGAQERLGVAIENTEESISQGLLPSVTHLSNAVSDWLSKSENQKRLQDDVNEAVKVGTGIVKGLAGGLRIVKAAAEPVVDALGGIEKAAQLALIVGIVAKVRRAAAGFLPLQASSSATAAKGVRDASIFGRAWDVATRPRNMVVTATTVGGGVPVPGGGRPVATPGGPVAPRTAGPGRPKIPFTFGFNLPTAVAGAVLISGGASGASGPYDPKRYPRIAALLARVEAGRPLTDYERSVLAEFGNKPVAKMSAGELARLNLNLAPQRVGAEGGDRDRPDQGRAINQPQPPPAKPPARGNRPTPRTLLDIQTDLARAGATPGTGDNERLLTEERNLFRKRIAFLESRKNLTDKSKQELQRLYGELESAQGELDSIADTREKAIDDARDKRQAARTAAAKKRAAAAKRQQAADLHDRLDDARSLSIGAKKQLEARFPMGDKTLERIDPSDLTKSKTGDDTMTRDELGSILRDFLTGFGDTIDRYYGNVGNIGPGSITTATLEHLTREQTSVLKGALGRPHVGYTRLIDEAAMQT